MSNKPGRKPNPKIAEEVEAFKKLTVGQSFFVAGKKASDMEYLRRPVKAAGLGIAIRYVECDPVNQVAGVRVWRQAGTVDEEL